VGWKNKRDLEEYLKRKSARYAKVGVELEDEIEELLQKMQDEGVIADFEHFTKNSKEDHSGKDFRARKEINGVNVDRFFGVTISLRSWPRAKALHPKTPQFCFPIGAKPETMRKRILELFD